MAAAEETWIEKVWLTKENPLIPQFTKDFYRENVSMGHECPRLNKQEVKLTYDGPEKGRQSATHPDIASEWIFQQSIMQMLRNLWWKVQRGYDQIKGSCIKKHKI